MRDRIIKANIKIRNCPEDLEKYIVVRTDETGNWFWGTYPDRLRAIDVARHTQQGHQKEQMGYVEIVKKKNGKGTQKKEKRKLKRNCIKKS